MNAFFSKPLRKSQKFLRRFVMLQMLICSFRRFAFPAFYVPVSRSRCWPKLTREHSISRYIHDATQPSLPCTYTDYALPVTICIEQHLVESPLCLGSLSQYSVPALLSIFINYFSFIIILTSSLLGSKLAVAMTNLVWSAQKRGKRRKRWNVLEHTRIPTRQLEHYGLCAARPSQFVSCAASRTSWSRLRGRIIRASRSSMTHATPVDMYKRLRSEGEGPNITFNKPIH